MIDIEPLSVRDMAVIRTALEQYRKSKEFSAEYGRTRNPKSIAAQHDEDQAQKAWEAYEKIAHIQALAGDVE